MRRYSMVSLGVLVGWLGLPGCGGESYDPGETTAILCQDGSDNDDDGKTDCDDSDCQGFVFCSKREDTAVMCQDDIDNDGDGETDCGDIECWGFLFCVSEGEDTVPNCQDGMDNDEDSLTDCDDPECQGYLFCQGATEDTADLCQDDLDNDGDQLTDCEDPGCQVFPSCEEQQESTAALCQDGVDNDGDHATDCFDSDCQGFTFCDTSENETTAVRCQDQLDNDWDGDTDCDDADCQGFVFCGAGGETSSEACQDNLDNDDDSMIDCEDDGCWAWGFCQHYQGFPVVDAWGETWDGIERPALPYTEAATQCAALRGRLPTATEIHRNNATTGTGDLSDDQAVNPLWTRIASSTADTRVTIRLSDGTVSYTAEATPRKFRCVWPDDTGSGFDPARCHGAPADPCWAFERFWNVDRRDRPTLDYAAATNECSFYGASIPVPAEWGRMIHGGLPGGTNQWLWGAKAVYWYNGNYGMALVRWTDENAQRWQYDAGNWGSLAPGTASYAFRCIGLARPADFTPPDPVCTENCMRLDARRSTLVADDEYRVEARMSDALGDCRAAGGDLPNLADVTELVHAGWPNGSGDPLWLTDAVYWYNGNYGHAQALWQGIGPIHWVFSASTGGVVLASTLRKYRCVWRTRGPALPSCQDTEVVEWDGEGYACQPGGDGSSNGQANVVEIPDEWGNAWDGIQREVATFEDARTLCEGLGGRLPTASEVYAGRYTSNPHDPIGQVTDTSNLWTLTRVSVAGSRAVVRVSDGASTNAAETTSQYFRCIWPAVRGNVLAANACYGPPGDACFVTPDGLVSDRYDRVALDVAGAINECLAYGGGLPDHRETARLLHQGWPNGTDVWLWMDEPVYWYTGGYGYAMAKWTGDGAPDWEYAATSTGSLAWATDYRPFRCVYSTTLR